MRISIVAGFLSVVSTQLLFAQCPQYDLRPPHLKGVVVENSVSLDRQSGVFTFSYTVRNGDVSTGCINGLEIDILAGNKDAALSDNGLVDYPRYVNRTPLELDSSVHVVPVGIPRLPSMNGLTSVWFAGFSQDGTVSWFRAIPDYRLAPGSSISGIVMTSHALPGLRMFVVTPSYNPKPAVAITPENEDSVYMNTPEPTAEEDSAELALRESIKVRGWTVGPTAPPLDFSASSWIDTLASYKHCCVTLGWLRDDKPREHECEETMRGKDWYKKEEAGKMRRWEVDESWDFDRDWNNGIIGILDRRLEKAKQALTRGDSVRARRDLQIFVMEVELVNRLGERAEARGQKPEVRDQKPAMTGEAHALLKYNAEYLIDRLPEKHGRPEEGRREGRR